MVNPDIPDSHIQALFALLDDSDVTVQQAVRERLIEIGDDVTPALREYSGDAQDPTARLNAAAILREIGLRRFRREITSLSQSTRPDGDLDLEQGVLAIATIKYPELQFIEYSQQLDTMASTVEIRLRERRNGYEVLRELNRYLVDRLGFRAVRKENYYAVDNSCINHVLEQRVGIPVSLAVVYLLLASRLGLPLYGVGFPAHFLLRYKSSSEDFFIDAFNRGLLLSREDCKRFLGVMGIQYDSRFLEPVDNRHIIGRMMRNLVELYRAEEPDVATVLEEGIAMINVENEGEGPTF